MEDNKVLVLDDVSVRYRKQDSRSTSDIFKRILGKSPRNNEFWALKNISFSLEKGDMLGVIGKNGAGKSTMMKAISGTLTPASGTITKEGRICALLELGTGFDREMTVRENVYLREDVGLEKVILRPNEAAGYGGEDEHEVDRDLGGELALALFELVAWALLRFLQRFSLRQLAGVEILGVGVANGFRVAEHDHAPLVEPKHLVALLAHGLHRVRDHERRRVAGVDDALHLLLAALAEITVADGENFVEDYDIRLHHACDGEGDTAFHAA